MSVLPGLPTGASNAPGDRSLRNTLTMLQEVGIRLALLRGSVDVGSVGGDVDVLVDPASIEQAEQQLRSHGWLRVPSPGHGCHRFFVTYDADTSRWYHLDLVTSLDFGPLQGHRTEWATACLARSVQSDGVPRLHPDDTFWALFAHLSWKDPTAARFSSLAQAALDARLDGPMANLVHDFLGRGAPDPAQVLEAARSGDEATVLAAQEALRKRWRRSEPLRTARAATGNWLARRFVVAEVPGLSIAFLGLDGAGKTTVAARLHAEVSWPTVSMYMGVWRTSSLDLAVQRVLGAQLVLRLGRLVRTTLLTRYHRALGRVVLLDRYLLDAALPSADLDWKGRISRVLVSRTGSPPDRLVMLDAPAEVVFARKGELTIGELTERRDFYRGLSGRFPQWVSIDVDRPLSKVLADVNELLWSDLVLRYGDGVQRMSGQSRRWSKRSSA